MGWLADVLAVVVGAAIAAGTVLSAVATFVVPRGVPARLTRIVFRASRRLFDVRVRIARTYEAGESVMAWYAPLTLVALVGVWFVLLITGFTLIFRGLGVDSWELAIETAGSSLTTLGFVAVTGLARQLVAFVVAALGLLLLALLISYLPTIYGAFQRREALVTRAAMQAGSPPSGVALLRRFHAISGFDALESQVWQPWVAGFVDIEESHTSLSALAMFRSTQPHRSWVTAAGAVMDTASLLQSSVEGFDETSAQLMIRAGSLSLRAVADHHGIPHDPDPSPDGPISISRDEWEAVLDGLARDGVPIAEDRDAAWRSFVGWRVNYDAVVLGLAEFTMAPYAEWNSDRSAPVRR